MKNLFKISVSLLLSVAIIISAIGCSSDKSQEPETETESSTAAETDAVAETFTATTKGYGGDLTVELTVQGEQIKDLVVTEHQETEGIGSMAVDSLPAIIVENQSIAVDAVTGATISSEAIIAATELALTEAGLDVAAFTGSVSKESSGETVEKEAQIVIAGAGGAGISAALTAAENGADVILIEKMPMVGGATSMSGGGIVSFDSYLQKEAGVEDSKELFRSDILSEGRGYNDPVAVELLVDNAAEGFQWLVDKGVEFRPALNDSAGNSVPRAASAAGKGIGVISTLMEKLEQTDAEVIMDTAVYELIVEDDVVTGVKAKSNADGTEYVIKGDSIILATGGYAANPDMLDERLSSAIFYGHTGTTGDGQLMAQEIGAKLINMEQGAPNPNGIEVTPGYARHTHPGSVAAYKGTGAIMVDKDGKRVVNELDGESEVVEAMQEAEGGVLYMLMDQAAFDLYKEVSIDFGTFTQEELDTWLANNGSEIPIFTSGSTLAEAVEPIGIDIDNLEKTVETYNGYVAAGNDSEFGRAVSEPIGEGPYYIIKQDVRLATTYGGVKINENFQVEDESGNPIEGLYAAGEVVGGPNGYRAAPGCASGWAYISGHALGRDISAVK